MKKVFRNQGKMKKKQIRKKAIKAKVLDDDFIERLISEDRSYWNAILKNALFGVYVIDEGKFLYVNRAMAKIFGYEPRELVSKLGPLDLTDPEDHLLVKKHTKRRLKGEEKKSRYIFRGICKNGRIIFCEVLGGIFKYKGRNLVVGTIQDITDRKRTEKELRHRYEFENLITTISTRFIHIETDKIDREITRVLKKIGEFAGIDRSYVFLFHDDRKIILKVIEV